MTRQPAEHSGRKKRASTDRVSSALEVSNVDRGGRLGTVLFILGGASHDGQRYGVGECAGKLRVVVLVVLKGGAAEGEVERNKNWACPGDGERADY